MPRFTVTYPGRCLCKLPVFLRIGYRTSRSRLRCWSRSARHTTADPTAAHRKLSSQIASWVLAAKNSPKHRARYQNSCGAASDEVESNYPVGVRIKECI